MTREQLRTASNYLLVLNRLGAIRKSLQAGGDIELSIHANPMSGIFINEILGREKTTDLVEQAEQAVHKILFDLGVEL